MPLSSPIARIPATRRAAASCRRGLAVLALLGSAVGGVSAQSAWTPQGGFVQAGRGEDVSSFTAGLTWPWEKSWALWGGRLGGYWEASASRWNAMDPAAQERRLNQFAVTPVFRWRPGGGASAWFAEGAIGLTYMSSRYQNGNTRFSTRFNFGDHLGVGRSFGPQGRHELALRLQHFSNGGVRKPNPGEDFVQLRYAASFR